MNKRRELIMALGAGALGISLTTAVQRQTIHRVGILITGSKSSPNLLAFMQELRRLGYIEGQNVSIVSRFAEGNLEHLPAFAAELVAQKVDVVFSASTPGVQAARLATASIPIVLLSYPTRWEAVLLPASRGPAVISPERQTSVANCPRSACKS